MFPFDDFAWRRVINCTGSTIRASYDQPIVLLGFQMIIELDGEVHAYFIATSQVELRALEQLGHRYGSSPVPRRW